jgi:hypothetical protein
MHPHCPSRLRRRTHIQQQDMLGQADPHTRQRFSARVPGVRRGLEGGADGQAGLLHDLCR